MVLVTIFLASCESTPGPNQSTRTPTVSDRPLQISGDIQSLLAAAGNLSGERANALYLEAAEKAITSKNADQTKRILALVKTPTDPANLEAWILVNAQLALLEDKPQDALAWLTDNRLNATPLTQAKQIKIGTLKSDAYYLGRSYLASARERIFIDELLRGQQKQSNQEQIFNTLLLIPARSLSTHAQRAITSDVRGWLSLAAMTRRYEADPLKQLQELRRWQTVWSSHPAAENLPTSLRTLSQVVENQPDKLALFLPLQGDLGPYGRAIRDSIISSRFETNSDISIQLYDTSAEDIESLLARAVADDVELIIGPLDRSLVTRLAGLPALPIPVLALNRTIDGSTHPDLYQFGLAPEDEMIQVAEQAFKEGKRNALAIFPASDWGSRNFEAFRDKWQTLGGNLIDTAEYVNQPNYSDMVKQLLDVDLSEKRAANLRRIIGQSFEFTPRRRQDIDFVFLLGTPDQARGINPTLAFYYAEDIPVYSTSHVYEYSDSRIESIDLNGIIFCDIPWKLTSNSPLQSSVQEAWPASRYQLAPFYALGIDAFKLFPRLQQMKDIPNNRIYGATGVLSLDANNVLQRELMWARFDDGEVVVAPMIVENGVSTGS